MSFSFHDRQKVPVANAHLTRNGFRRLSLVITASHLRYFIVGYTSLLFALCASSISTAFFHHVSDVVLLGSEEQVIGVDAPRGVTSVENPQTVGNRAIVDDVREAVGEGICTVVAGNNPKRAIARSAPPSPKPAFSGVGNLRNKPLTQGQVVPIHVRHRVSVAAIFFDADTGFGYEEPSSAEKTVEWYSGYSQGVNLQTGFVKVRLDGRLRDRSSRFVCPV